MDNDKILNIHENKDVTMTLVRIVVSHNKCNHTHPHIIDHVTHIYSTIEDTHTCSMTHTEEITERAHLVLCVLALLNWALYNNSM